MVTEVDGRPTPKIIDFGVAKATEQRLTDLSLADTGAIVGTPTYMSPEQADPSSMDIDTRTDVYALGVILYELLAGSPPLDAKQFKRGAILEMLRMVREVDPPRPSTKVSTSDALPNIAASRDVEPAHLKRALQGDLDWIVMMALEKDRTRRYETANGFAADILRHLAHEPVVAAPPSQAYRLRKFVRKHRGAVIAASLVLVTLLGGLAAVAAVQTVANARLAESLTRETNANAALNQANGQLSRSRAAVQARYELATDAIKTFHTGVSEDFLLKEEKFKDLRNRLLNSASDFYGKLGALLGKETDLPSRRALAQANFELSDLTDKVGRKEDALAAHRQVLAAREALAAESGADVETKVDVGLSLTAVAGLLSAAGKTDEAEATYRKAETLLADLARSSPSTQAARAALAYCRAGMGLLRHNTGKFADALVSYRLARDDQEALADAPGASKEARHDLAETILRTAVVLQLTDKKSEAEAEFRKAIALMQKLADDYPAITEFRSRLASSLSNLGILLLDTGRESESEAEFRKAIALLQKLADDYPAVTQFRFGLALNRCDLTGPLSGKASEAETEIRKAIALLQKLADDDPAVIRFRMALANSHYALASRLSRRGKPTEAEAEYRAAVTILEKVVDDDPKVLFHRDVLAVGLNDFGGFLLKLGRSAEALDTYGRAVTLFEQLIKENPADKTYAPGGGQSLVGRGRARRALGDPAGAAADVRHALRLFEGLRLPEGYAAYSMACSHSALAGLAGARGHGRVGRRGKGPRRPGDGPAEKGRRRLRLHPRVSHRGCPRPAPRAGGLQETAHRAGAEIGRQAEVTERLRDRGGYRIGGEWKRGSVDDPTYRVGANVWPVGLIPTPCGVDTDSRELTVIIGGLSCLRNALVLP
jgi:tetratricopeptide (TPR) repeat protein